MSVPLQPRAEQAKGRAKLKVVEWSRPDSSAPSVVLLLKHSAQGLCDSTRHEGLSVDGEEILPPGSLGSRQAFRHGADEFELIHWSHTFAESKGRRFILFHNGVEYDSGLPGPAFWRPVYIKTAAAGLLLFVCGFAGLVSFIEAKTPWLTIILRLFFLFCPLGLYYIVVGARGLCSLRGGGGQHRRGPLSVNADAAECAIGARHPGDQGEGGSDSSSDEDSHSFDSDLQGGEEEDSALLLA